MAAFMARLLTVDHGMLILDLYLSHAPKLINTLTFLDCELVLNT